MLKVILVASGKGGTGKTSLTAGVGAALAQLGSKVLLIDGDCGLRNLDIVLGMSDRVATRLPMWQAARSPRGCMACHPDTKTLYSLTAPVALPALSERGMEQLAVQAEEAGFDYLLIDGPAGLPAELSFLAHIATQAIIVTSTDRVCVRGAERCARKLEEEYCIQRIRMVLNRVRPQLISHGKSGNIDDAMDEAGLPLLGLVPEDVDLISCSNSGRSIHAVKHTGAARAFMN
ncbi:MAG: P-loop NTPase, partial [Butyricicoccus sp.]